MNPLVHLAIIWAGVFFAVIVAKKTRLTPGKSLVMALVQGEPETRCDDVFERYGRPFGMLGFEDRHLLRGCGLREAGAIAERPELLAEAEHLAHRLVTARLGAAL